MAKKPAKHEIIRDEEGKFVKGVSGNPDGRPKGLTIKEQVRKWLEEHPDDMQAFVDHFIKDNRELTWQMLEGRPQQDVTSAGEKIETHPIYGALSRHPSDKEDIQPEKKD